VINMATKKRTVRARKLLHKFYRGFHGWSRYLAEVDKYDPLYSAYGKRARGPVFRLREVKP